MTVCNRCFKETNSTIMSMFNTDIICMACKTEEKKRSDYGHASRAETAAVKAGVKNYKGIEGVHGNANTERNRS